MCQFINSPNQAPDPFAEAAIFFNVMVVNLNHPANDRWAHTETWPMTGILTTQAHTYVLTKFKCALFESLTAYN